MWGLLLRPYRSHPLPEAGSLGNPTRECGVEPTATDTASVVARGSVRRVPTGSWRRAMAADDTHHTRYHVTPRYLLPDTAHSASRDISRLPLCRHPPSPPQHHVLAPHALRALPPHRTGHCLSPSPSGYAPAYPTPPCGVTEMSPLRGSERQGLREPTHKT